MTKKDPFLFGFADGSEMIEPPGKPLKSALMVAGCFFVTGVLYILFSSHVASLAAATIPELASIEQTKGFLFILVTSLLLFGLVYALFLRINRQQRRLLNFGNRLISAERQATAVVLADSIAHDLGNVLMSLEYYAGELAEAVGQEHKEALERIGESQNRLKSLVQRLNWVGGRLPGKPKMQYFNLAFAVNDALRFAGKHRSVRNCKVVLEAPDELMFMGHLLPIYQMVINLVLNAVDAANYQGEIWVHVLEQGDSVSVEVHDSGPGIPENRRDEVLEPFYTTKENGSGLGLLSVQACAHAHQGEVVIGESDLGGARVAVRLRKTPPVLDDPGA